MIAIFDSGVGGLSILKELTAQIPNEDVVYFGDTANVPYGEKSAERITEYSLNALQRLLKFAPKLVVVACNTATSVAIGKMRKFAAPTPLVGVVPAVKRMAEITKIGRGAVVATEATLATQTYADLKRQFAASMSILDLPRPEWVAFLESEHTDSAEAQQSISDTCARIQDFGADTLVLGSTHFPWLKPAIEPHLPGVEIIDSGAAVARQAKRLLSETSKVASSKKGSVQYLVSGDAAAFSEIASRLLGQNIAAKAV